MAIACTLQLEAVTMIQIYFMVSTRASEAHPIRTELHVGQTMSRIPAKMMIILVILIILIMLIILVILISLIVLVLLIMVVIEVTEVAIKAMRIKISSTDKSTDIETQLK